MKIQPVIALLLLISTGCTSLNRMSGHVDMMAGRLSSAKPHYEGRLVSHEQVGPMTSLQFDDGKIFDVEQASLGLQPGDIVRIFKTEKGLNAILWRKGDKVQLALMTK